MLADIRIAMFNNNLEISCINDKAIMNRLVRYTRKYGFLTIIASLEGISSNLKTLIEQIIVKYSGKVLFRILGDVDAIVQVIKLLDTYNVPYEYIAIHIPFSNLQSIMHHLPSHITLIIDADTELIASSEWSNSHRYLIKDLESNTNTYICMSASEIVRKRSALPSATSNLNELAKSNSLSGIRVCWSRCWDGEFTSNVALSIENRNCLAEFTNTLCIPVHFALQTNYSYCGAEHRNHIYLDHIGNKYKCWKYYWNRNLHSSNEYAEFNLLGKEIDSCSQYKSCPLNMHCVGGCAN